MTNSYQIWTGGAEQYDQTRPAPPPPLLDLLTQLIYKTQPELVVDLGCGTGLSTRVWAGRTQRIIGIEPNADMRGRAISYLQDGEKQIEYREGFAHQTGLPDGCADIVTCSQSFHWMEPVSTLAEVARVLRSGGIFAVYDYEWPPTVGWEIEQVYQEVNERFDALQHARQIAQNLPRWSKKDHLERMQACGYFRYTRELFLHHVEKGNAERFVGLVMTNAISHQLKQKTMTAEEIKLDRLLKVAQEQIGDESVPWYFSYWVRIGVK